MNMKETLVSFLIFDFYPMEKLNRFSLLAIPQHLLGSAVAHATTYISEGLFFGKAKYQKRCIRLYEPNHDP